MEKTFKTHEPSTLDKILQLYWANPKSWRLDKFTITDDVLTFSTQNGKRISAPLEELSIKEQTDKYDRREVYVKHGNEKLHFKEIPGMLEEKEWDAIFEVLKAVPNTTTSKVAWLATAVKILQGIETMVE